jgi:hypothetical protein
MREILQTVPGSNGKEWHIIRGHDGVVYCDCPAWRFRRTCKHLQAYEITNPIPAYRFDAPHTDDLDTAISQAIQLLKSK